MKHTILVILFSLVSLAGFAQNDHLEPIGGYFDMYSHQYEYYANIRSILFKGMLDNPVLRYLVIPSFETEYVLQVDRGEANNKYYINVRRGKQSIWYEKDKSKIEVEKWRNSISLEDLELIKQLYRNAILKTQYVVRNTIGMDGTRYYFSVNDMGSMSGQTWSPGKGSTMEKLVNISEAIMNEAKATTFVGFSAPLRAQIKELTLALFL